MDHGCWLTSHTAQLSQHKQFMAFSCITATQEVIHCEHASEQGCLKASLIHLVTISIFVPF